MNRIALLLFVLPGLVSESVAGWALAPLKMEGEGEFLRTITVQGGVAALGNYHSWPTVEGVTRFGFVAVSSDLLDWQVLSLPTPDSPVRVGNAPYALFADETGLYITYDRGYWHFPNPLDLSHYSFVEVSHPVGGSQPFFSVLKWNGDLYFGGHYGVFRRTAQGATEYLELRPDDDGYERFDSLFVEDGFLTGYYRGSSGGSVFLQWRDGQWVEVGEPSFSYRTTLRTKDGFVAFSKSGVDYGSVPGFSSFSFGDLRPEWSPDAMGYNNEAGYLIYDDSAPGLTISGARLNEIADWSADPGFSVLRKNLNNEIVYALEQGIWVSGGSLILDGKEYPAIHLYSRGGSSLTEDAWMLAPNYFSIGWLGGFYEISDWCWSERLGWFHPLRVGLTSYYLWTLEDGWLYVETSFFPWAYRFTGSNQGWFVVD